MKQNYLKTWKLWKLWKFKLDVQQEGTFFGWVLCYGASPSYSDCTYLSWTRRPRLWTIRLQRRHRGLLTLEWRTSSRTASAR